jgi:hypothetical protein
MATALATTDSAPSTQLNDEQSVKFSLIWLDTNSTDFSLYANVRANLRFSINCIETFEQPDQCENYIRHAKEKCHHIVVFGKEFARSFTPCIHDLSQVSAIYIYADSNQYEESTLWIEKYPKVKGLFLCSELLFARHCSVFLFFR